MKPLHLTGVLMISLLTCSGCKSSQPTVAVAPVVAVSRSPTSTHGLVCFAGPSMQEKSPGQSVEIKLHIMNEGKERLFTGDDGDESTGPWWVEAARDNKPIKFSAAGDERYRQMCIGSVTRRYIRQGVPCEANFPVSEFFDMTIPGIYKFTFSARGFREDQGKVTEIPVEPVIATVIENRN